jgi:hypothetical protein
LATQGRLAARVIWEVVLPASPCLFDFGVLVSDLRAQSVVTNNPKPAHARAESVFRTAMLRRSEAIRRLVDLGLMSNGKR